MWLFIFVVLSIDILYTWDHRINMYEWEANPIQLFLLKTTCIYNCLFIRILTVFVGFVAIQLTNRLKLTCTVMVFLIHLVLFLEYLYILGVQNGRLG